MALYVIALVYLFYFVSLLPTSLSFGPFLLVSSFLVFILFLPAVCMEYLILSFICQAEKYLDKKGVLK